MRFLRPVVLAIGASVLLAGFTVGPGNAATARQVGLSPISWQPPPSDNVMGRAVVLPDGRTMSVTARTTFEGGGLNLILESSTSTGGSWSTPQLIRAIPLEFRVYGVPMRLAVSPSGSVIAVWSVYDTDEYSQPSVMYSAIFSAGSWSALPDVTDQYTLLDLRWTSDGTARLLSSTYSDGKASAYLLSGNAWRLLASTSDGDWYQGAISAQGTYAIASSIYDTTPAGYTVSTLETSSWSPPQLIPAPLNLADESSSQLLPSTPPVLITQISIAGKETISTYRLEASQAIPTTSPTFAGGECCLFAATDGLSRIILFSGYEYAITADVQTWTAPRSINERVSTAAFLGPNSDRAIVIAEGTVYVERDGVLVRSLVDWTLDEGSARPYVAPGSTDKISVFMGRDDYDSAGPLENVGFTALVTLSVPGSVQSPTATAGKRSLTIRWAPPSDIGGSPILRYEYQVNAGPWKKSKRPSVTLKRLQPKKRVTVTIRAVNAVGVGTAVKVTGTPK